MADPLFWLALSFLLVVISLTAVLMVAIPALRELGRAARSAEKLFDTLGRELPPTLEAIRLTGLEITELTDDVTEGVQGAGQVVQQVSQSLNSAQTGAKQVGSGTRSLMAGVKAAWRTLAQGDDPRSQPPSAPPEATQQDSPYPPSALPPGFSNSQADEPEALPPAALNYPPLPPTAHREGVPSGPQAFDDGRNRRDGDNPPPEAPADRIFPPRPGRDRP